MLQLALQNAGRSVPLQLLAVAFVAYLGVTVDHIAAAAGVSTLGLFGPSYPHLYAPWGDHAGYVCTPQTFDELIDFEGYDAKTLNHTLMDGLTVRDVKAAIQGFDPLFAAIARNLEKRMS